MNNYKLLSSYRKLIMKNAFVWEKAFVFKVKYHKNIRKCSFQSALSVLSMKGYSVHIAF